MVSSIPNESPLTAALQAGTASVDPLLMAFSAPRRLHAMDAGPSSALSTVIVAACIPAAASAMEMAAARFLARIEVEAIDWSSMTWVH